MRGRMIYARILLTAAAAVPLSLSGCAPAAVRGGERLVVRGQEFAGSLDPVPFQAPTRSNVGADGRIEASLFDFTLQIAGRFSASPSPATRAWLVEGLGIGVPGTPIGQLAVDKATAGTLSGSIVLTQDQIEALHLGHLYVRIDTEKAPNGSAWGWLLMAEGESE